MEVAVSSAPTRSSSSLNPNAPSFVPMSFRAVEDFSDQWWHLVHSSPWFRDYWLGECFLDPQTFDVDDPHQDAFFDDLLQFQLHPQNIEEGEEGEEVENYHRELLSMGALKWRRGSGWEEVARNAQKAPKIVKAKGISPRTIQQPR